jgi:hypothetical protein
MERHLSERRAAVATSIIPQESLRGNWQTLLGGKELPQQMERTMHRMGIQSEAFLLACEWHLLSWQVPGKLAKEDAGLPHV